MRVGERTDYNRLRMAIETDGTLGPRDALERAIEIMIHQLKAIVGFQEQSEPEDDRTSDESSLPEKRSVDRERKHDVPTEDMADIMKTRIDTLEVGARTLASLAEAGIRTVGGLARKREEDILAIDGLGIKGLQEIKKALSGLGVSLKQ